MPDAMRGVLLCMLEAVEGELCWLEVPGDDTPCATLYAGGCRGCALFAGGVEGAGGDALSATYSVCWRLWRVGSASEYRNFRCGSFLVTVRHLSRKLGGGDLVFLEADSEASSPARYKMSCQGNRAKTFLSSGKKTSLCE